MRAFRQAFVICIVVVAVVVSALALWHLRLLVFLFLLGVTWAAAMRPGVERLARSGMPRAAAVLFHLVAIAGVLAMILWLAVPQAINQIDDALGDIPTSTSEVRAAANDSTGVKHDVLVALQAELEDLPSGSALFHPAFTVTKKVSEVLFGLLFVLATSIYWIFERDRAERVVLSLVPAERREAVRSTWNLIDLKLGAFVRGQLLMITFVSATLSCAFAIIGLPFWLLLGVFAGVVEIVPVVGPLAAGTLAVGVGLSVDWRHAAYAAIAVWGVRLLQDYLINPRVFGHAVGLSPLLVLITVTSLGLLLGGVYVLLSVPLASIVATVVDVTVLGREPDQETVPRVLFPANDAEE
jgi:predicted PurR-regulated permease PerM